MYASSSGSLCVVSLIFMRARSSSLDLITAGWFVTPMISTLMLVSTSCRSSWSASDSIRTRKAEKAWVLNLVGKQLVATQPRGVRSAMGSPEILGPGAGSTISDGRSNRPLLAPIRRIISSPLMSGSSTSWRCSNGCLISDHLMVCDGPGRAGTVWMSYRANFL